MFIFTKRFSVTHTRNHDHPPARVHHSYTGGRVKAEGRVLIWPYWPSRRSWCNTWFMGHYLPITDNYWWFIHRALGLGLLASCAAGQPGA